MDEFPVSNLLREFANALLDFAKAAHNRLERAGLPRDEANQLALLREPPDGLRDKLKLLKALQGEASPPAWELFDELAAALEEFLQRLPNT